LQNAKHFCKNLLVFATKLQKLTAPSEKWFKNCLSKMLGLFEMFGIFCKSLQKRCKNSIRFAKMILQIAKICIKI